MTRAHGSKDAVLLLMDIRAFWDEVGEALEYAGHGLKRHWQLECEMDDFLWESENENESD